MENFEVFTLKLYDRKPMEIPMERLADYIKEYALILGKDNNPVFSSVEENCTLIRAQIPKHKSAGVVSKLKLAQAGDAEAGLGKRLLRLESMMPLDGISKADFLDSKDAVLVSLDAANDEEISFSVAQESEIDGEITGVIGADDTMHITLREWGGRILKVVSGVDVGRKLGHHIRSGYIRLHTFGQWNRTDSGWRPDSKKCHVASFEVIADRGILEVFNDIRLVPGNGWAQESDPMKLWREIRGLGEEVS